MNFTEAAAWLRQVKATFRRGEGGQTVEVVAQGVAVVEPVADSSSSSWEHSLVRAAERLRSQSLQPSP